MYDVLTRVPAWLGAIGLGGRGAMPGGVLHDMVPYSWHFQGPLGVNEPAALANEGAIPRFGIISIRLTPHGLLWQALKPDNWEGYTTVQYFGAHAYLMAYEYYSTFSDYTDDYYYEKTMNAPLWLFGAGALLYLDVRYCDMVGDLYRPDETSPFYCPASDAVVPAVSQTYPGAQSVPIAGGPPHTRQTTDEQVRVHLYDILRNSFGVQPRPVSISVSPQSAALYVGQTLQLSATGTDAFGNPVPNVTPVWSTTNASVASVNASTGVVSAIAPGSATILAQFDSLAASVPITVTSPPPISSVTINGPSSVGSRASGTWVAGVQGGVPPLQYTWKINGSAVSGNNSNSLTYTNTGSPFTISVTVGSSVGSSTKSASKSVTITSSCGTQVIC